MTRTVSAPELSVERRRVPQGEGHPAGALRLVGPAVGVRAGVAGAPGVDVGCRLHVGAVDVEVEVVARTAATGAPSGPGARCCPRAPGSTRRRRPGWPCCPTVGAGGLDQVAAACGQRAGGQWHRRSRPARTGSRRRARGRPAASAAATGCGRGGATVPPPGAGRGGVAGHRVRAGGQRRGRCGPDVADLAGPERRLGPGAGPGERDVHVVGVRVGAGVLPPAGGRRVGAPDLVVPDHVLDAEAAGHRVAGCRTGPSSAASAGSSRPSRGPAARVRADAPVEGPALLVLGPAADRAGAHDAEAAGARVGRAAAGRRSSRRRAWPSASRWSAAGSRRAARWPGRTRPGRS